MLDLTPGAAGAAQPPVAAPLVEPRGGQLEPGRLPLRSLVIEDVAGAELTQRHEARAGDVLALAARHPDAHRQRGEVVAGQEALAGEVAVRIEVALVAADVASEQQVALP